MTTQPRDERGRFVCREDDAACPACNGDDDYPHDCGWVNDDCPAGCSTEHAVHRDQNLHCPADGAHYRYCEDCGWEELGRWNLYDDPYIVNGRILCTPEDHGYDYCSGCDTYVDQDDLRYSEYDECYFCESCYGEHRGGRGSDGEHDFPCHRCNTLHVHVNLHTEDFLCDCEALNHHRLGHPVEFDHDAPVRKVIAVLTGKQAA